VVKIVLPDVYDMRTMSKEVFCTIQHVNKSPYIP
jgi:hypothetical protein